MRNVSELHQRLKQLGLSREQAMIFTNLLDAPKTQLEVSRATGIARSNVYRIVDGMIEKGLVCESTTDAGKLLASAAPDALELLVIEQEAVAQRQRSGLSELLPLLKSFQDQHDDFAIKTYSSLGGLKQMLWNELASSSEILLFSGNRIDLATTKQWAEKYRLEVIDRGLKLRGIENYLPGQDQNPLSAYDAYTQHYQARYVPMAVLHIKLEISIHDDTLSIYNSLAHGIHLGTEITNPFLAAFMRQVFEHYWSLGSLDDPE